MISNNNLKIDRKRAVICFILLIFCLETSAQIGTYREWTLEEALTLDSRNKLYEGVYHEAYPEYRSWDMTKAKKIEQARLRLLYDADIQIDSTTKERGVDGVQVLIGSANISSIGFSMNNRNYELAVPKGYDYLINWHVRRSLSGNTVSNMHMAPMKSLYLYEYDERQPEFNWELCDSTTTIEGYECQMAKTSFRGRDWTVWFTPEISVDCGFWKFSGLPGLIMKAEDSYGYYRFMCVSIEKTQDYIEEPTKVQRKKMNRKDFREAEVQFFKTPIANGAYENNYKIGRTNTKSTEEFMAGLFTIYTPNNYSVNYYPMELE